MWSLRTLNSSEPLMDQMKGPDRGTWLAYIALPTVQSRPLFLVGDRSVRKTGPSFDHSVQDRAQTEPLVLDRRQTGPDRSKRYINVAIVTVTQRVNNDYKVPQLRFIQY
ncbi:hypothetical protein MP228_012620 [Amoeboaphelidium protococcarum]|nr:hypothetical protein MP228_012620 [Amoeboaphelidium protococcarum]